MFHISTTPARFDPNEIHFQIWKEGNRTKFGTRCMMTGSLFLDSWDEKDLEYLGADLKALIVKEFRAMKESKTI